MLEDPLILCSSISMHKDLLKALNVIILWRHEGDPVDSQKLDIVEATSIEQLESLSEIHETLSSEPSQSEKSTDVLRLIL
jgi:hypothetical protein